MGDCALQVWAAYSPVKNSPADARAKAAAGSPSHSATTGELDIYQANCRRAAHHPTPACWGMSGLNLLFFLAPMPFAPCAMRGMRSLGGDGKQHTRGPYKHADRHGNIYQMLKGGVLRMMRAQVAADAGRGCGGPRAARVQWPGSGALATRVLVPALRAHLCRPAGVLQRDPTKPISPACLTPLAQPSCPGVAPCMQARAKALPVVAFASVAKSERAGHWETL